MPGPTPLTDYASWLDIRPFLHDDVQTTGRAGSAASTTRPVCGQGTVPQYH